MSRSLWPREHGAYAQLIAPLATALVVVRPTAAAGLFAIAACAAFLANEPLLVMLGQRGKRMREHDGARATRRLVQRGIVAAAAGVAGLVLAPRALSIAAIVAVPAALTIALAWRRLERTLVGEIAAAAALSGAAAPVLVASGTSLCVALAIWGAWSIGYACTVLAVHRVIARHKAKASWRDLVVATVLSAACAIGLVLLARGSLLGASVPLALGSLALVARPPRATYLRTIGIALCVASAGSGVLTWTTL